jgi:hypothetical protein
MIFLLFVNSVDATTNRMSETFSVGPLHVECGLGLKFESDIDYNRDRDIIATATNNNVQTKVQEHPTQQNFVFVPIDNWDDHKAWSQNVERKQFTTPELTPPLPEPTLIKETIIMLPPNYLDKTTEADPVPRWIPRWSDRIH